MYAVECNVSKNEEISIVSQGVSTLWRSNNNSSSRLPSCFNSGIDYRLLFSWFFVFFHSSSSLLCMCYVLCVYYYHIFHEIKGKFVQHFHLLSFTCALGTHSNENKCVLLFIIIWKACSARCMSTRIHQAGWIIFNEF